MTNRQQRRAAAKKSGRSAADEFNLGAAAMAAGRLDLAEAHLRRSLALKQTRQAHHNLGSVLTDRAPAEAIAHFRQALRHSPADSRHHNSLVRPLYLRGRKDEAIVSGARTLILKDADALAAWSGMAGPSSDPLADPGRRRDVVAFSLWGDVPLYTQGAIENAGMIAGHLPGWTCRVYHDDSVPPAVLNELAAKGAELVAMPRHRETGLGLFWRFGAAVDPSVRRFLCRDADSRPSPRETAAIEAWVASGRDFHVIRDEILHCEVMLAGLWGGKAGLLPDLPERAARWQAANPHRMNARVEDQRFLRFEVWPLVRGRALIHDSVYRVLGSVDFPAGAPRPAGEHVGMRRQPAG